jgi:hypothetical protein
MLKFGLTECVYLFGFALLRILRIQSLLINTFCVCVCVALFQIRKFKNRIKVDRNALLKRFF